MCQLYHIPRGCITTPNSIKVCQIIPPAWYIEYQFLTREMIYHVNKGLNILTRVAIA